MGHELFEKTIGVLGLGKIGYGVAKRLKAFEATIIAYDPIVSKELADQIGVELVELDELMEMSDIITIHAPKIPETMNLINNESLK